MPLSIAISYFNKYSYHRFPVINRKKKLVGILTSRDVLVALLKELSTEIDLIENRTENRLAAERATTLNAAIKEFHVKKHDFEKAGQASFKLKKMLKERNVPQKLIRRASVAAYELEINLVIHSDGGRISFLVDDWRIIIISRDEGPGIADVSLVLQEGYSTADEWIRSLGFGAGMGLANTRRVSDEFDIQSEPGKGTTVTSIIYLESGNETFSPDEKA
jgi:anti-sigma regulatory factor (Ser/Thr protein kinase)